MPLARTVMMPFALIALAAACAAPPSPRQTPAQIARPAPTSPLIVQTVAPLRPVMGADGRQHLVHELLLVNQSAFVVTVDAIASLDGNTVLQTLAGDDLARVMRINLLGGPGAVLQPSQSAFVFLDVTLPADAPPPQSVSTRITATRTAAPAQTGELGGLAVSVSAGPQPTTTFDTPPAQLAKDTPIVLAPPVRGSGWIIFRGCCDVATSHRAGVAAHGGAARITERFAIDLVHTNSAGMLVTGPGNDPRSYPQYGATVHAVASGTIVSARNTQPDESPGQLNPNLPDDLAGGNAVVLDIGGGRFVYYAHLQPGSVTVSPGDVVKAGDVIGKLGNSGRSFAPHLHLHVTDSAEAGGDGLPFTFSSFTLRGALTEDPFALAQQGRPATASPGSATGPRHNQLPLNNHVVDFGE
jgi:murein DD-endopeptidase MepM/ murein hydrolase activator NlpD